MGLIESSRRARAHRSRRDILSTIEDIRHESRMPFKHDLPAFHQLAQQLDQFAGLLNENVAIEFETVESGTGRMRNIVRRSLAAKPADLSRLVNAAELLKDQLIGYIKDHT